jgi:hypothetical protein
MGSRIRTKNQRHGERGSTIYLVAGSLVILLGMGALAIDLASLYVARNESQRAADSAALAGAKVFVESGCVTSGDCTGEEATATDRATQAAGLNLVGGFPVTIQSISFNETSQNPQITVQLQSANLNTYFAKAIGMATAPTVGATATAEAYNPSGAAGGPTYCTGCVRPWLVANCDKNFATPLSGLCAGQAYLLNPGGNYSVANAGCFPGGVVGEPVDVNLQTAPTLFGAVDVDNGTGNLGDYQQAITTCFTGQTACGGKTLTVLAANGLTAAATTTGVENLMHIATTGLGAGQDYIDTSVCPPRIHAGALNPLVTQGVVPQDTLIATSDSIVTAYIFDNTPLNPLTPTQAVTVVGFAQIFVTQADPATPGEFFGVILGVAGCGSNGGGCGGSGAIKGPTMLPVRLIQPGN